MHTRRYAIGGLVGGMLLGIPAVIQNPEHRWFAAAAFGTAGMLMGAGVVAIFAPRECPVVV